MSNELENLGKWTDIQREFMLFLALPKPERPFKTQRAFAKHKGINEDLLSAWKRLPNFTDEVASLARDLVKDDVPEVLATIRSLAKKGSQYHTDLFLKMAGLSQITSPKNELTIRIVYDND